MQMVDAGKIWTVIQARTGSRRLPGKVLEPFGDGLLIDAVFERAEQLGPPVAVCVPTRDYRLIQVCKKRLWTWLEGPENDVLGRYLWAARYLRADHIVRVTADCPFLDVEAGKWTIESHLASGADFTFYEAEGRGIEVFTRKALLESAKATTDPLYREHPDLWILEHQYLFNVLAMKFSVDTQEELELARSRIGRLHQLQPGTSPTCQ